MGRPGKQKPTRNQLIERALDTLTRTILGYLALDRNMAALQQKMMNPRGEDLSKEMAENEAMRMKLNKKTREKLEETTKKLSTIHNPQSKTDIAIVSCITNLKDTIMDYLELDRNMAALREKIMTHGPSDPSVHDEMIMMMRNRMDLNLRATEKLEGLYHH
jgi:hypothetical protein